MRVFKNVTFIIFCVASAFLVVILFVIMDSNEVPTPLSGTLTIGTSASISSVLLTVAEEEGFFEEKGINVRIKSYKTAGEGVEAMLANDITIAAVAETPIVYQSFKRDDFQIFATIFTSTNDPKVIARLDKGVKRPLDLLNKRIGTTKKGQSAHFFLHLFMLKHGIDTQEINLLHSSPKNIIKRLKKGELDAASLFEPHVTFAKRVLGKDGIVFAEPGIYFKTFNLVAKKEFLQKNREAVRRLLAAIVKSERFALQYPDQVVKTVGKKLSLEKEIVKKCLDSGNLNVTLSKALLLTLNEEANWAVKDQMNASMKFPDYLSFIHFEALETVRPESVNIQR